MVFLPLNQALFQSIFNCAARGVFLKCKYKNKTFLKDLSRILSCPQGEFRTLDWHYKTSRAGAYLISVLVLAMPSNAFSTHTILAFLLVPQRAIFSCFCLLHMVSSAWKAFAFFFYSLPISLSFINSQLKHHLPYPQSIFLYPLPSLVTFHRTVMCCSLYFPNAYSVHTWIITLNIVIVEFLMS